MSVTALDPDDDAAPEGLAPAYAPEYNSVFCASRIATADFPNMWGIDRCDGADSTILWGIVVIPKGPACPFSNSSLNLAALLSRC